MTATTVEELPIAQLKPAKDNPRQTVGDVVELTASIKAVGLLEPIVAMPQNGHHLIVCGERRYVAAKKAGLKTVPVVVREFSEPERVEAMLIENLQRENLGPLEEAGAYSRLVELGHTQRQLAERVGRSQAHISKRLALLKLPADVRKKIDSGGITIEDAVALTRLVDHPRHLKKALASPDYYGIAHTVDLQLQVVEREKKMAAAVKKAEGEGLTVITAAGSDHYYFRPPAGVFKIAKSPTDWETLPIDPKTHAKEPCHAVGIEPRTLDRIPLCTDRKRHPKAKTANEKRSSAGPVGSSGRNADWEKREQELAAAGEARQAFVQTLLAKKPPKDVLELVHRALVRIAEWGDEADLACILLGLEGEADDFNAETALREFADRGETELAKAAAAVAFAYLDETEMGYYRLGTGAPAYLGWLERHGYELSKVERERLKEAKN